MNEARELLLGSLRRVTPRRVPLDEAIGCVLAEAVVALEDVPPFANSAMDGFAVRAEDAGEAQTRLRLVGAVAAGSVASVPVGPGCAMAIATGAPLPFGADAVCVVERTVVDGDEVVLEASVARGDNVRLTGEEIARGTVVFERPSVIGASHIGVLTSVGVSEVTIFPRARVGVLSTGDELCTEVGPLQHGKIHDSNRHALLAAVACAGCEPVNLGVVGDDAEAIARVLQSAVSTCDAIITSGGVSVGVADHMKRVLATLSGGAVHWMEIAIRPAKPFGFAVLANSRVPVLCLPGNPVATMVSFELLARPALRFIMGHHFLARPAAMATAEEPFGRRRDGKDHFVGATVRVDAGGRLLARPTGGNSSGRLRSVAQSNALAILPDCDGVEVGEMVRVMIVEPDGLEGGLLP